MNAFAVPRRADRGFSLIEILIGLAVGLLGVIVIMQAFSVNEGFKRSTAGSGEAQTNGLIGLFAIERELRMAGYGFTSSLGLGCRTRGYTSTRLPQEYDIYLAPAQIHPGAGNAPDMLSVNYGNSPTFVSALEMFAGSSLAPGGNFRAKNRAGVELGDFLVATQAGVPLCTLFTASALPFTSTCNGGTTTDTIEICSGACKVDPDGVNRCYNAPGGVAGQPTYTFNNAFTTNTNFFNLGPQPAFNIYGIQNGSLAVCNARLGDCALPGSWTVVAEGIVSLRVQYGLDRDGDPDQRMDGFSTNLCRDTSGDTTCDDDYTAADDNGDGIVDRYAPANPTGVDWGRVQALRIALLARSQHMEKRDAAGNCVATTAATAVNLTYFGNQQFVPPEGLPSCFRYRVFETVIPLRNLIWRQS